MAEKTKATAILAHSTSGNSARLISACRPKQPIYGLTPDPAVLHALNFSWGMLPYMVNEGISGHLERVEHFVDTCSAIAQGDEVIITAGQPKPGAKPRGTNLAKIYRK
jgi:pyruvate kinase